MTFGLVQFITARMKECEPWKSQSEVEFDNSVDCMEKLVMNVSATSLMQDPVSSADLIDPFL
jgi:hypothetical protein